MREKSIWKLFIALAVAFAVASEFFAHVLSPSPERQVEKAQARLRELEARVHGGLDSLSHFKSEEEYHHFFGHSGQKRAGISYFVFRDSSLKYWSDNELGFSLRDLPAGFSDEDVLQLPAGTYEGFVRKTDSGFLVALVQLRRNYSYENQYLVNHFNIQFGLSDRFRPSGEAGGYLLKSSHGKQLMSLAYSREIPLELPFNVPAWLYFFAYLFLVPGLCGMIRANPASGKFHFLLLAVFLFALRWMMIRFHLPGEMYYTDLFGPKVYASSFFFNSIGDLLLNTFTIFAFLQALYQHMRERGKRLSYRNSLVPLLALAMTLLLGALLCMHALVAGIVLNSKVIFDITNAAALDSNTLSAALSILFLLWSFYFLSRIVLHPFGETMRHRFTFFIALTGALLVYFGIVAGTVTAGSEWMYQPAQPVFGIFIFMAIAFGGKLIPAGKFEHSLLVLTFLAAYASYTIGHYDRQREMEGQRLFAQRLDSRQDLLAEYLFDDVQQQIARDPVLRNMLLGGSREDSISRRVIQNYFTGYWNKFDITVQAFDSAGRPVIKSGADSLDIYLRLAEMRGRTTEAPRLFFLPNTTGRITYLAILPMKAADGENASAGTLVLRMSSRILEAGEGFPELFLNRKLAAYREAQNYSFARYTNDTLGYAYGDFPYSIHASNFRNASSDWFISEGFRHVVYRPDASSIIVVSKVQESFLDRLSFFTYVLIFFLLFFLGANVAGDLLNEKEVYAYSLKQRIRSSMIFLVVISFILIAAGTSVYIIKKYDTDQTKNILSRLNAIWFALTDRFPFDENIAVADKEAWREGLNQLVTSFNLDYNLYDAEGNLFYSSQPKLFDREIVSPRIHPEALFEINQFGHTQFLQPERIGKLRYVAAYAPFTDRAGRITGYLNLPYFEKQNELNREISGFISALINIYMLLLVLSLLLALVVSSRITQPLLLMQQKLGTIRLGSRNEPIEWKRNDEIGQLVREYNRMVDELAESAEKLAKSERESAWREMAQQVAHEIKNPLTPMKLSLQHLQKAWSEKSANLDELFPRISQTLIEQINTLSHIASEFSNFAMMPRVRKEVVDVRDVLASTISLFNQTPGMTVEMDGDAASCRVLADREQLARIFSNLLKNAIQSIPDGRKGDIRISLKAENNRCLVSVRDNGIGIPEEQASKIFTPSFTTKSGGMGLGLAMVKSMVESFGGEVWFETTPGEGSTFFVELPMAEERR